MKQVYNFNKNSIRLCKLYSLIFFALVFFFSCKDKTDKISLVWNDLRAVAIFIPKDLLDLKSNDKLNELLQVKVENRRIAMLGEYKIEDGNLIFRPFVPLTHGLSYDIFFRDKLIGKIKVPLADGANAPVVKMVYPTADTLPENLLKMYIRFSSPMREGESLKYISLLDEKKDTLTGIFLDLQPELWNIERTVLTVWLDPGRIKRDLIPNQKMGNPLQKGKRYILVISNEWKDVQGLPLQQPYSKQFMVGARDSVSPELSKWKLNTPVAPSEQPLEINFGERLDNFLLPETISIVDENNKTVPGKIIVINKETGLRFTPLNKWQRGKYTLQVQSILEDLAGNNLNKLFDRDIQLKKSDADRNVFEKTFEIK